MQRFLIKDTLFNEEGFVLQDMNIIFQLIKVLRSKLGDNIVFFNGNTLIDYIYEIKNINKKEIIFKFIKSIEKKSENNFNINLYQALPNKLSRVEYILQKGVETGISNFIFFRSERSQKLVLSDNKIERLKKIITEATEQSSRNIIPEIKVLNSSIVALLQGLQSLSLMNYKGTINEQNLFFHTKSENSKMLKEISLKSNTNLFVGPEGGWNDEEISEFNKIGFTQIYLGSRILRCETVSSVASFYLGL